MTKEKRKKRIIELEDGSQIVTLTTYWKFKKRLESEGIYRTAYSRKTGIYSEIQVTVKELQEKKPKRKKKEQEAPKKPVKEKRIRKQTAMNFINRDADDSGEEFISIRAITINPAVEKRAMLLAIKELMHETEVLYGVRFRDYEASYVGLEEEEIGEDEDRKLNDYKIHLELFMGGKVISTHTK